jgi:hypothetical protein
VGNSLKNNNKKQIYMSINTINNYLKANPSGNRKGFVACAARTMKPVLNGTDFKQEATASLYDFNGKKIKDFTLTKGENKIENDGLAIGTYIVVVSVDEKTDVKQIIIK